MKCQSLFSGKHKRNIINLLSAEFAQRMIKVNVLLVVYIIRYWSYSVNIHQSLLIKLYTTRI